MARDRYDRENKEMIEGVSCENKTEAPKKKGE